MAAQLGEFAASGLVNIVGGCCGTTPDHIHAIGQVVEGLPPRRLPDQPASCRLSGLEALEFGDTIGFVNIGERTNVAGSARFAKLVRDGDFPAAVAIARQQVMNGAQVIDVNMDDAMLDAELSMQTLLRMIAGEPDITRVPMMIDSSKWSVSGESRCMYVATERRLYRIEAGIFEYEILALERDNASHEVANLEEKRHAQGIDMVEVTIIQDEPGHSRAKKRLDKQKRLAQEQAKSLGAAFRSGAKDVGALSILSRYEAAIERSLYKALHELQRAQAARQNGRPPPSMAVDVTGDGPGTAPSSDV
jgi:hypothetical protein